MPRGVDELKQIIQPCIQPCPLVMSTDPLARRVAQASRCRQVVRDIRVRENLGALEPLGGLKRVAFLPRGSSGSVTNPPSQALSFQY